MNPFIHKLFLESLLRCLQTDNTALWHSLGIRAKPPFTAFRNYAMKKNVFLERFAAEHLIL